jgi:hypothetical protein
VTEADVATILDEHIKAAAAKLNPTQCGNSPVKRFNERMIKKVVQQGRSERRPEAYAVQYVEGLSDARTTLAAFFSIL